MSTLDPAPENTSAIEQVRVVLMDLGNELKEKGGSAAEYLSERADQLFDTREKIEALRDFIATGDLEQLGISHEQVEQLKQFTSSRLSSLRTQVDSMLASAKEVYDEHDETIKAVGAGALIAAGAYAVYRFGKWLFGKTKEGAHKTAEAARSGFGWLSKLLLLGGIGFAGYIGTKKLQSYLEKRMKEKVETEIAKATKKVQELEGKMRTADDAAKKKLAEEMQRQQATIENLRKELQEQGQEKETPVKKKTESPAPITTETPVETPTETLAENVEKGNLVGVTFLLEKVLDNDTVPDVIATLKDRPMSEVFVHYDGTKAIDIPSSSFYEAPSGTLAKEAHYESTRALIELCGRNRIFAEKFFEKREGKSLTDVTLGEFLEKLGGSLSLVQDTVKSLKKSKGDLLAWKPDEEFQRQVAAGNIPSLQSLGTHLPAELKENLEKDLEGTSMQDILEYLKKDENGITPLTSVNHFLDTPVPKDPMGKAIREICTYVCSIPFAKGLAPFFHNVLPNGEWSEDEMRNAVAIVDLLKEMKVHDVLRLYAYNRMMKSDEKTEVEVISGLTMTQAEILRMIREKDETLGGLLKPDFYEAGGGFLAHALYDPASVQALLEQMDVPKEYREQAAKIFMEYGGTVAAAVGVSFTGGIREGASAWMAANRQYPVLVPALTGTGIAAAMFGPVRAVTSPVTLPLWYTRYNDPDTVAKSLKNTPQWFHRGEGAARAMWAHFIEPGAGYEPRIKAGKSLDNILHEIDTRFGDVGREIKDEIRSVLRRGSRPEDWNAFLSYLDSKSKAAAVNSELHAKWEDLKKTVTFFAHDPDLEQARHALSLRQQPLRERIGLGGVRNPNRIAKSFHGLLDDADLLDMMRRNEATPDSVEALIRAAAGSGDIDLDSNAIAMIHQSKKAKEIIAGAIATSDVQEVARALRAAKLARNIRLAGGAAGGALDLFGVAMAIADWQEHKGKIEMTKNVALQELYEGAQTFDVVEGATNATGVVIGGVACISTLTSGGTILTAIAAPAGTVMLPIGLAVAGAAATHRSLEEASETWLKTPKDWQRHDVADIAKRIMELGATASSVGQHVVQTVDGAERIQAANEGARSQLYRAYVQKTHLPVREENETDSQYRERSQLFTSDALRYIAATTGGNMGILDPEELENAVLFARLSALRRKEGESPKTKIASVDVTGKIKEISLQDFLNERSIDSLRRNLDHQRKEQQKGEYVQLAVHAVSLPETEKKTVINNFFFERLRHDINQCEARIRAKNFPGIGDGAEQQLARGYIRYILEEGRRQTTDALLRTSLDDPSAIQRMQRDIETALNSCRMILQQDPTILLAYAQKEQSKIDRTQGDRSLLYLVPGAAEEQHFQEQRAA